MKFDKFYIFLKLSLFFMLSFFFYCTEDLITKLMLCCTFTYKFLKAFKGLVNIAFEKKTFFLFSCLRMCV